MNSPNLLWSITCTISHYKSYPLLRNKLFQSLVAEKQTLVITCIMGLMGTRHGLVSCFQIKVSHKVIVKPSDRGANPLVSSTGMDTLLLASSLGDVGLRISANQWILVRGLPPLFAKWTSPQGSSKHGSWLLSGKRERN